MVHDTNNSFTVVSKVTTPMNSQVNLTDKRYSTVERAMEHPAVSTQVRVID
jgi:hypothetical protein